jgi:nucleoid-associated protein YgaU
MIEAALTKMKILAFKDNNFSTPIGVYVAQVNPESYSIKYNSQFSKKQAPGTSTDNAEFIKQYPEEISFDFIFDSTGVLEPALVSTQQITNLYSKDVTRELGVEPDLQSFKAFVFSFDGEIHQPRFLILNWGTLLFKCCLTSMSVKYKLFRPGGIPVRAVASCTFRRTVDNLLRMAIENMTSPDLTHVRTVKAGDTLPGLCQEIYGDPGYYEEVARANELSTVMKLTPGTKLFFPPIEEETV